MSETNMFAPWRIEGEFDADASVEIIDAVDWPICEIDPFDGDWTEAEIAGVRAMAAAPELLAALKGMVADAEVVARRSYHVEGGAFEEEYEEADYDGFHSWRIARAAIAKAEGRA
jgi:hypothetical protein